MLEPKDFSVYLIGRGSEVHVQIDDASVSRIHAELVVIKKTGFFLTDRVSSGGTFVARGGAWQPVTQEYVTISDTILLGRYQTSVKELVTGINRETRKNKGARQEQRRKENTPDGPVRRNPETGEVERDDHG